jgi:hypothetical protein
MKRYGYLLVAAVVAITTTGCTNYYGEPDYTASGALVGGTTGMIAGSMSRSPAGPLVGAAVGALAGGIIGHGLDQEKEARLRAQAPMTVERIEQNQPMTLEDVKELNEAGVSDDLIITQIRNSYTVYHLTTANIIDLKDAGVNEKVIDYMINTASRQQTAAPPPPPVVEQVVVSPGPEYVWVGGMWVWGTNHWIWHPGYWHRPVYIHRYRY